MTTETAIEKQETPQTTDTVHDLMSQDTGTLCHAKRIHESWVKKQRDAIIAMVAIELRARLHPKTPET